MIPVCRDPVCGRRITVPSLAKEAEDPRMIDHDFDRQAIIEEMDDARATLHRMLAGAASGGGRG